MVKRSIETDSFKAASNSFSVITVELTGDAMTILTKDAVGAQILLQQRAMSKLHGTLTSKSTLRRHRPVKRLVMAGVYSLITGLAVALFDDSTSSRSEKAGLGHCLFAQI